MRLHAVCPWHRADEPGLQEGAPLVHQATVSTVVVLFMTQKSFSITHSHIFFLPSSCTQTQVEPPTQTVHVDLEEKTWGDVGRGQDGKHCLLLFRFSHLWWHKSRTYPVQKNWNHHVDTGGLKYEGMLAGRLTPTSDKIKYFEQ